MKPKRPRRAKQRPRNDRPKSPSVEVTRVASLPLLDPASIHTRVTLRSLLPAGATSVPDDIIANLPPPLRAQAREPDWFGLDCTFEEVHAAAEALLFDNSPAVQSRFRVAMESARRGRQKLFGAPMCNIFSGPPKDTDPEDIWRQFDDDFDEALRQRTVTFFRKVSWNGWLQARCLRAIRQEDATFFVRLGRSLSTEHSGMALQDKIDSYLVLNWLRQPDGAECPLWRMKDPALCGHLSQALQRSLMLHTVSRRRQRLGLRSIHS